MVGIGGMGNRLKEELYGGKKKRVEVEREIVMEKKVMIMDEKI